MVSRNVCNLSFHTRQLGKPTKQDPRRSLQFNQNYTPWGIEDDPPFIYCCLTHGHRGNPESDLKKTGLIKDTPDQSIDTLSKTMNYHKTSHCSTNTSTSFTNCTLTLYSFSWLLKFSYLLRLLCAQSTKGFLIFTKAL